MIFSKFWKISGGFVKHRRFFKTLGQEGKLAIINVNESWYMVFLVVSGTNESFHAVELDNFG